MLSDSEIERWLPVWHALADLFLDTWFEPEDYRRIAAALRASGYERSELRAIFEEEVAPAFVFNLIDVAGEWASWNRDDVREIMLEFLRPGGGPPPLSWLKRRVHRRRVSSEWSRIEAALGEG